jgi:large subunit ribosomal protein L4
MSYQLTQYLADGTVDQTVSLDQNVFNDDYINHDLIHEFVLLQQANMRQSPAHTKTRGDVSYSGRKLFRQKGNGTGRTGSLKSPTKRHGGVAFGPRNVTNWTKKMPLKMRKLALKWILTLKAKDNELVWLSDFPYTDIKTKNAYTVLKNLKLDTRKTLVVIPEKTDTLVKSFRNLPKAKYLLVHYLNPLDLLSYKHILIFNGSLEKLSTWLA